MASTSNATNLLPGSAPADGAQAHPLAKRVAANHAAFAAALDQVRQRVAKGDHEAALQAASDCAHRAWMQHSGVFAAPELESLLAQVGHVLPPTDRRPPPEATPRRVLTVLTSVHAVGGHSRIAWRWIGIDTRSQHTLVLTQQEGRPLPEQLRALAQAGRVRIVQLDAPSWLGRAVALRDLVAQADQVVLLTHPHDVLPCTAVPAVRNAPPVLAMDHASHVFWLGVGISTLAINTATMVLEHRRGIARAHIGWALLPMDFSRLEHPSGLDVRAAFGIPAGAPLLLSAGSPFKYRPIEGTDLAALLTPVLEQHPDAHLLVVGVAEAPYWQSFLQRFAGRVHLSGYLPEPDLAACYHACDVYVDSVPLSSPTTVLEAAALGKPIVRYAPADWRGTGFSLEFDCIPADFYLWSTPEAYAADIHRLLHDAELRHWRGSFGRAAVRLYYADDTFRHSIEALYAKAATLPRIVPHAQATAARCERIDTLLVQLADNMAAQQAQEAARQRPRVLAFHRPQYHATSETDGSRRDGISGWDKVRGGQPLFEGHAQPLVPTELGCYDGSSADVLAAQARLAREHGLHGFCFHYHWCDGHHLQERPVDLLLAHPEIDLPFCLSWANDSGTRDKHGLLTQKPAALQLHERFASDVARYFADPRYVRIGGRPVLLVYRADVIPNLADATAAWRGAWRERGVGEVYLVAVESFAPIDPTEHGFDATAEFPPHQVHAATLPPDSPPNLLADPDARVGDYGKLAHTWLARPRPLYKRFHGVLPGWDDSAGRRGGATLFAGASPEAYEDWLTQAVGRTLDELEGDERLVFVNAWNEWGKGCTLEPDARWGRAYLEATRRVLQRPEDELRVLARESAPPSEYACWLEGASAASDDALWPALREAGADVVLAVAVSDSADGPAGLAATHASLSAQLRPADQVAAATPGESLPALAQALAGSGWTLCLCAGDTLAPDALAQLARALAAAPDTALIAYMDHDERDAGGHLGAPCLKPAFNQDLLLSCAYMGRALAVRTGWLAEHLARAQGATRFDLAFSYGLTLGALRERGAGAFIPVPVPALHLTTAEPAVFATDSATWQAMAQQLAEHAAQAEPGSQVLEGPLPGSFHLLPPLPRTPLVSIIIPTRDQLPFLSRCIESLLAKTAYPAFELLVVDNDSQTAEAREFLAGLEGVMPDRIRVLRAPGPFNFSRMNNLAAREARGEYLLLLNNDTAALQADWLTHLVRQGLRPGVGAVGARLLFPDGRVQHAGVVLGLCGPADHPLLGLPGDQPGYQGRAQLTQDFSAVTAACLLVPKAVYDEVGGLDEAQFGVSYNDVDFCLRIGATGRRIVWTPLATLLHEGSASQRAAVEGKTQQQKQERFSAEQAAFYARWPALVARDPHYSPHLSLSERNYEIETRTVLRPDPLQGLAPHHVAVFAADATGCGQYRILQPLAAMRDAGLCIGAPSPELLPTHLLLRTGADTLVFQRPYTEAGLAALAAARAVPGVRTIYEVDDHMAQVPVKSIHHQDMPKDLRGRILKGIGLCDRLVVSTEPLAQALGPHAAEVRVAPNRLPPRMWGSAPPVRPAVDGAPHRKPRIGWAGGAGHLGDLDMVADVVRELADEVEWVFFGMCPPALRPYVSTYYAGVPTLDYPRQLMAVTQGWDLAIAPLEANAFNECKSNLRLLEYGWCGVPVVCSDVLPYQGGGLPVRRVRNRFKDWAAALRERLADLPATRQEGAALQQQVAADWVLRGAPLKDWCRAWTD